MRVPPFKVTVRFNGGRPAVTVTAEGLLYPGEVRELMQCLEDSLVTIEGLQQAPELARRLEAGAPNGILHVPADADTLDVEVEDPNHE